MAILGPTASGKSAVALELALRLNGEIVNADSRQIYKYMDAGTSMPDAASRARAPHHLYDFLEPNQTYSAGDYARAAQKAIQDIQKRGRTTIVAGGTGLYARALFEGIAELPGRDEALRKKFMAVAEARGRKALHDMLAEVDPDSARKIPAGNIQRVLRALEVHEITKKPLSDHHREHREETMKAGRPNSVRFGLRWERDALKKRIRERTEKIAELILREAKALLEKGYQPDDPGCQSLGYRQAILHLRKKISRDEYFQELLTETNQYAKRQMTWFNRDASIHWIEAKEPFDAGTAADEIAKICRIK